MKRLILAMFLTLLSGGFTFAGQYTLGANGFYFDAAGNAYTRSQVDNGSYVWNGCRYVWVPAYSYTYTPVKLDLAAPDFESQALAIVAAREKAKERLALLDKLGLSAPGGLVSPNQLQLGSYGANGNTIYGYPYTYSQIASLYNTNDPALLYQQASSLAKGSQDLGGQATAGFLDLVKTDGANRARFAEILAQGLAAEKALQAARAAPQATVSTTVTGTGTAPKPDDGAPVLMPRLAAGAEASAIVADSATKDACMKCHSGAQAKGKLDLSKAVTKEQYLRILNRISLPATDPRHMPQALDGSAAPELNHKQIADLLKLK